METFTNAHITIECLSIQFYTTVELEEQGFENRRNDSKKGKRKEKQVIESGEGIEMKGKHKLVLSHITS